MYVAYMFSKRSVSSRSIRLLFALLKEEKNSSEKIRQSNTIDTISYHRKTSVEYCCDTVKQEVHQIRFYTVLLYHTVSRAGVCYLTMTYESVLILTILHHIVNKTNEN